MASAMSLPVVAFGNARCRLNLAADAIVLGLAKASGFGLGPVDCHPVVLHRRVSAGVPKAMVVGAGSLHHALHCDRVCIAVDSRYWCTVTASHVISGAC